MRKITFILAAICILATSCVKEGPMGPMGPMGPKGEDGASARFAIVKLEVPAAAWTYSAQADNNYYMATVDVPEITEEAFDYGVITAYRTFNYDDPNASQIALPYVRLCEQVTDTETFYYTENIDFEYGIGWVNIYFTASDFYYPVAPEAMVFRLAITY